MIANSFIVAKLALSETRLDSSDRIKVEEAVKDKTTNKERGR